MNIRKFTYLLPVIIFFAGCINNEPNSMSGGDKVTVTLKTPMPGSRGDTYANGDTEYEILEVDVIVFHEDRFFEYEHGTVVSQDNSGYDCSFRLTPYEGSITLWFIANCRETLASIHPVPGDDIHNARNNLLLTYTGTNDIVKLPMSCEVKLSSLERDSRIVGVEMIRALAKVDVNIDAAVTNFVLNNVRVIKTNDLIKLIPDSYNSNVPSIPQDANPDIETLPVRCINSVMQQNLYIPESEYSSSATAAKIILGGTYNGEETTYYSVDFKNQGNPVPVMRNKKYMLTITDVSGPGAPTPGEIPDIDPIEITVEVVDWEEDEYGIPSEYMAISSQQINLKFYQYSTAAIWIESTYDDFNIRWCDSEGIPIPGTSISAVGEELYNSEFKVIVEDGGKVLRATALTDNEYENKEAHVLVTAANINFVVTINQSTRGNRPFIDIFNITNTYGNIGDELLDIHSLNPTPNPLLIYGRGLRDILKNSENFGINGKVPFSGYYIAGLPYQTEINPYLLNLFNIVYIPAAPRDVVSNEEAANLINWVQSEESRVLIIQTDWGYNGNLLNELGVTSQNLSLSLYTLYALSPQAPEYFHNGPFGKINSPISIAAPGVVGYLDHTEHPWITPIVVNSANTNQVIIGIDLEKKIVYNGDFRLYTPQSFTGKLTGDGLIENDYDRLVANLWGWIAEMVLGDVRNIN